jgi:adenylylsulfate reductase subunit B
MAPTINQDLCHCCGTCYDICPQDVFGFREDEIPTVDYPDECWYCGACVLDCPVEAVALRLPLQLRIVPSPANYGEPGTDEADALRKAAAFSRSVTEP